MIEDMKLVFYIVGLLVVLLLCFVSLLLIWISFSSKGVLPDLQANENEKSDSINERCTINIKGTNHDLFVRSNDVNHPVLLFVHGGPCMPELSFILSPKKRLDLERNFTVCYYEQRGCGVNYNAAQCAAQVNVKQLVDDIEAVSRYLVERFSVPQLYLLGHSFGAYLSIRCLQQSPSLYKAYVGIGQPTDQYLSEHLAWQELMERCKTQRYYLGAFLLHCFSPSSKYFMTNFYLYMVRNNLLDHFGLGLLHNNRHGMVKLAIQLMSFPGYTFVDKWHYLLGLKYSESLYDEVVAERKMPNTRFEMPVYFIHGSDDYLVSLKLCKEYEEHVEAPDKCFIKIENTAHSPHLEKPQAFEAVLLKLFFNREEMA